jgi:transketolase
MSGPVGGGRQWIEVIRWKQHSCSTVWAKAFGSMTSPSARIAIGQASIFRWERYEGGTGRLIVMETSGASAPLKAMQKRFGFEPERVDLAAKELLGRG